MASCLVQIENSIISKTDLDGLVGFQRMRLNPNEMVKLVTSLRMFPKAIFASSSDL